MANEEFEAEVERTVSEYERLNRHAATRTRQMIERDGAIKALSKLMTSADIQQGFKVLRDQKQLDKSFEAVVVKYRNLFRASVVEAAQWRLDNAFDLP